MWWARNVVAWFVDPHVASTEWPPVPAVMCTTLWIGSNRSYTWAWPLKSSTYFE